LAAGTKNGRFAHGNPKAHPPPLTLCEGGSRDEGECLSGMSWVPGTCQHVFVRNTRVIYVENDPAPRGIIARDLDTSKDIEVLLAVGGPHEALARDRVGNRPARAESAHRHRCVLAVLAVLASQYRPPRGVDLRMGWAFVAKSGDMRVEELVDVLRAN